MKVSFVHEEVATSKGMLTSKTVRQVAVTTTVQFSEAEIAIIRGWSLENWLIMERAFDLLQQKKSEEKAQNPDQLRIQNFLDNPSDSFLFDSPIEAKGYQARLTVELKNIKNNIDHNASVAEATTFEL
jgi:hypothetical protein